MKSQVQNTTFYKWDVNNINQILNVNNNELKTMITTKKENVKIQTFK